MRFADLVRQHQFKQSWLDIIKGRTFRKEDGWILRHDGVRGSLESVSVNGEQFLKDEGCQPHDCRDNSIVILAQPKTHKIWMLHRFVAYPSRSTVQNFFGNPDGAMKAILLNYMAKS
ncbi:Ivy family c-type lysozyme inhibitor [Methylobacterium crusticola]|nr:Ivy family c-type lysozyme inhibitor [Methylobacterium crusticola]